MNIDAKKTPRTRTDRNGRGKAHGESDTLPPTTASAVQPRKGPTVLVELQVVIGTVHTVLVEAEEHAAAMDAVEGWDPDGDYPAAFVAVASAEEGRAIIWAEAYGDGDAAEWAEDNGGELVTD